MNIEDIHDEDSLEAFLNEHSSLESSLTIAARAALRSLPHLWSRLRPSVPDAAGEALAFVWPALAASVNSNSETTELQFAAAKAGDATASAFRSYSNEKMADEFSIRLAAGAGRSSYLAAFGTPESFATSAARAISVYDPKVGSISFWAEIVADIRASSEENRVWKTPLWSVDSDAASNDLSEFLDAWKTAGSPWGLFAEIYEGFLQGREPDWDYIERIVLIDPDIWEAGPEAVAEAIQIIDEQQRLAVLAKAQLEKLRRLRDSRRSSGSPGFGHNNPPESLSDEASRELFEAGAKAERALEELAEELTKTESSSERLDESSNRLLKALSIVAKYCGQKLDLAVDTLIKWGIPVGGAWLVANYTELSALANGAKALARLLGG